MSRLIIEKILDLARWAPSGDNTQPWRFEIVSDNQITIHGFDTRRHVLYDFDGHASHMAHGALLETLRLAATRFGLQAKWQIRPASSDELPIYDVTLTPSEVGEDLLVNCIESRTVQRRAMRTTPLTETQKDALKDAVGDRYALQFFEPFKERLAIARLLWENAGIRLTCPEAYPVHRDVIEWNARYSEDRIPEQAVGVDPITAKLMRWVMQRWERVDFFNRYLGGTIVPRVQLDFIPGLACAGCVLMRPTKPATALIDYVHAGVALQRLWLTTTSLKLYLQPEMTPLIFRWYVQAGRVFSVHSEINRKIAALATHFEEITGSQRTDSHTFFCRIGYSREPFSRSIRKTLTQLLAGSPND